MKIGFRRSTLNNKICGIEITLTKPRCNRYECLYGNSCKRRSKITILSINKTMKKLHLPIYFCATKLSNLSGTKSCSFSIPRKYDCYDCKHIGFDTSLNGYCKMRDNVMVLDDDGKPTAFAIGSCCKYQEISDVGKCWDKDTGKCNYEI